MIHFLFAYASASDLPIPDDNYEIIEDTDLNTTIEQIKNDKRVVDAYLGAQ